MTEDEIRADERERIAALLVNNQDTLVDTAADKAAVVGLIALALRIGPPSVRNGE